MTAIHTLHDLFISRLRETYKGEKKLAKLLPGLKEIATAASLKNQLQQYLDDNEEQIMRLRQVFESLFAQKRGEACQPVKAMLNMCEDLVERSGSGEVKDAIIIGALQEVIHYQIAAYGAICAYAKLLSLDKEGIILHHNLEEEKKADRALAVLAETEINVKASIPSSTP